MAGAAGAECVHTEQEVASHSLPSSRTATLRGASSAFARPTCVLWPQPAVCLPLAIVGHEALLVVAYVSRRGRRLQFIRRAIMIIMVQHTVRDYDAWKAVFDEHRAIRAQHGATGHDLYRGLEDRNAVTAVNYFPSKEQAEAFASDPSLKEAMERGGVISEPRITWAEKAESVDY
jgi:catechol 2,3-dioxygenase-like lactoylglutathione lyase family enzyme